jgi:hypothetical protein
LTAVPIAVSNSAGYQNAIFFISYLFVACFILLSMFFAILGEAQANLRDDERDQQKRELELGNAPQSDYGVLNHGYALTRRLLAMSPLIGPLMRKARKKAEEQAAHEASEIHEGASAVDRIESLQVCGRGRRAAAASGLARRKHAVARACPRRRRVTVASTRAIERGTA